MVERTYSESSTLQRAEPERYLRLLMAILNSSLSIHVQGMFLERMVTFHANLAFCWEEVASSKHLIVDAHPCRNG